MLDSFVSSILAYSDRLWLGVGVVLMGIAIVGHQSDQPLIEVQSGEYSSVFRGNGHLDPLGPLSQWQTSILQDGEMAFTTPSPDLPTMALLTFRYVCTPNCPQLWLTLDTQVASMSGEFLLAHPVLDEIDWFFVRDQGYALYQRKLLYETIEEMLRDGAELDIAADPILVSPLLEMGMNAQSIDELESLESIDFIMTTYAEPTYTQPLRIFSRQILLQPEFASVDGLLEWRIFALENESQSRVEIQQPVELSW